MARGKVLLAAAAWFAGAPAQADESGTVVPEVETCRVMMNGKGGPRFVVGPCPPAEEVVYAAPATPASPAADPRAAEPPPKAEEARPGSETRPAEPARPAERPATTRPGPNA